jgi:hypothetical protein
MLGTFAAILRELGQQLWFPGSEQAFDAVTSVVDIDVLTKGTLCAANRSELCQQRLQRGEWRLLPSAGYLASNCPAIRNDARWGAANRSGAVHSGQQRGMDAIVGKHGLRSTSFGLTADWSFMKNNVFVLTWDVFASTEKARWFGFPDMVDSEERFDRLFARYRALQILP